MTLLSQTFNLLVDELSLFDKRALVKHLEKEISKEVYRWGKEFKTEIAGTGLVFYSYPEGISVLYQTKEKQYRFRLENNIPTLVINDHENYTYKSHVFTLKGIRHYFEKHDIPQETVRHMELFFETHPLME